MAGIYIHIPFCKVACHYCNFHFSTNKSNQNDFVKALLQEIVLQQNYLKNENVETIYFGGGTPSVLPGNIIHEIIQALQLTFNVAQTAEITLEANPDDLSKEKIQQLKAIGINRFSLGIQSFFDEDLQWMNRAHTAANAKEMLQHICNEGFDNTTVDLIYGIPGMSNERWKENLQTLTDYNIPHVSAYCLTVEPKTALHKMIATNKSPSPSETLAAQHFETLINFLTENGYEHYEISNFAKPGHYSKHNTAYWQGKKYLGLGPSAHSFNGTSRSWNIANNIKYINSLLKENKVPFEEEILTEQNQFNELLMTGLRTQWGINLNEIKTNFSEEINATFNLELQPFLSEGFVVIENNFLKLSNKGKFIADRIISDLMAV
jgi:oxygen-independent coproporphyrinogen-3 oxidase